MGISQEDCEILGSSRRSSKQPLSSFVTLNTDHNHDPIGRLQIINSNVAWNRVKVFGNFQCFMNPVLLILFILISSTTTTVNASPRPREHHHRPQNGRGISVPTTAPIAAGDPTTLSPAQIRNLSNEEQNQGALILRPEHFSVPCGGVIHLFPRYGYFSLSMRVVSRNERTLINNSANVPSQAASPIARNDSWIFLEPVNNVIDPTTLKVEETTFSSANENESLPFHNLFHFDLCEDVRELMVAYFKNFTIEGLDKPWKAFSGGWRVPSIARYFGIDQVYVEGDYRFILAKIFLVRSTGTVVPMRNITASPLYKPYFQRFKANNDLSTYEFLKIVGTHYVHSYITGNAVYQVFVYDPDGFKSVLRHLFYDGVKQQTTSEYLQKLPEVFTKFVKYYGRVFVLNSSPETMDVVRKELMTRPFGAYSAPVSSLFKLHNNSELVAKVEHLLADEPHGILGIDLRGIDFLFQDPVKRAGFQKALKHKMQLWEVNFHY